MPFTGRLPSPGKSRLLTQDGDTPLPRGPVSLLGSRLFGLREKACLIRFLATLGELDGHAFDCIPLSEWVRNGFGEGNAARFLLALFRVSTYADDAERLSAGVAIEQLKLALKGNVWYIDGGWQTLVDGLRCRASDAGATVLTGTRVMSVCDSDDGVIVGLAGGEVVRCRAAVVAVPPKAATELLGLTPDAPLAAWTASSIPIKAACLDVALDRLERPQQRFALGLDRPVLLFRAFSGRQAGTRGHVSAARHEISPRRCRFERRVNRKGARRLRRPAPARLACPYGGEALPARNDGFV